MHDGCKVHMDSYMASNGSCVHGHLDYFQKPPLGGKPNTKLGEYSTPNITLFSIVTMLCGTDNIIQNILHIHFEYGEYST